MSLTLTLARHGPPERYTFLRARLTGRYGAETADALVDALLVAQAAGVWR